MALDNTHANACALSKADVIGQLHIADKMHVECAETNFFVIHLVLLIYTGDDTKYLSVSTIANSLEKRKDISRQDFLQHADFICQGHQRIVFTYVVPSEGDITCDRIVDGIVAYHRNVFLNIVFKYIASSFLALNGEQKRVLLGDGMANFISNVSNRDNSRMLVNDLY